MTRNRTELQPIVSALTLAVAILFCGTRDAEGVLHHGVIWYAQAPDDSTRMRAARRYDMGVAGKGSSSDSDKILIKSLNPDFRWFVYNSGTDNYVDPQSVDGEQLTLETIAAAHGWNVEQAYLHYLDDTRVVLQGDTLLIPGWGAGSAGSAADARVPVYFSNLSRRVVNFSTPQATQLHKELMVHLAFAKPFTNSSLYGDGIFLDNSASQLFNYGTILSGGHVRETPAHDRIGTPAFQTWQWNSNFGPYLTALKDTLETSSEWGPDGRRKYLMINIANIWDDSYATRDVADVLFMEFQYNPVRSFGSGMVEEAYRRDALAAAAGIATFYSATMTRTVAGHVGEYSYGETMLGNLVWYLTTRTASSIFYEMGTNTPSTAGWDTLTWRGCLDRANQLLGEVVGEPFVLATGTDPLGNAYDVHARRYEHGMVVLRNRGSYDQGIEPETAVTVALPSRMGPVGPEGDFGTVVTQLSLRNGQGALLLDEGVPVTLESFVAERTANGATLRWEVSQVTADHAGFDVYRSEVTGGQRLRLTQDRLVGPGVHTFDDPDPPAGGALYWLAEETTSGERTWYGPAELEALQWGVTLGPGWPNPFQESTTIAFSLEETGPALLRVFDVRGREVKRLFERTGAPGRHTVTWRGEGPTGAPVAPGVYFYRLETSKQILTRKLLRMR